MIAPEPNYMLKLFFWFCLCVFIHEYGHYIIAKKQKIYKGWDVAYGSIRINLEHKFNSRWDYLGGFAFSLIIIPIGLLIGIDMIHMVILQIFSSLLDFLVVVFYSKIP